jgi:hypothetical protein
VLKPILSFVLIGALAAAAIPSALAQTSSAKIPKTLPPKAKTAAPAPGGPNDVESDFYGGEDPDPPPPDENQDIEYSETPDDSGIEYADEAERKEKEAALKKAEDEKKRRAQKRKRPPTDEPMPLIRRQREVVHFPNKQPPKRIRHPYAAKGLTKITKDKLYIYKVKTSDQKKASSFRFGFLTPNELQNKNTKVFFDQLYDSNIPVLLYDYEWQVGKKLGKLGLKLGTGIGFASGNGQFKNDLNGNLEPKEKFTFIVFPNTAGAVYRFQYTDNQILVPYIDGGGALFTFGEFRDDGQPPKAGVALGAYAAAGAAFSLDFLDPVAMLDLDREYSINNLYIIAEYRKWLGFGNFVFTSDYINGGMLIEF